MPTQAQLDSRRQQLIGGTGGSSSSLSILQSRRQALISPPKSKIVASPTVSPAIQKKVEKQIIKDAPKPKPPVKLPNGIKLNLTDPQQAPSAQQPNTPENRAKAAKSIKEMDKFTSRIAKIYPTTNKLFQDLGSDPLTLKANPSEAVDAFVKSIKEPLNEEKKRINKLITVYSKMKPKEILNPLNNPMLDFNSERQGAKLEVLTGGANVVFSPLTGLFAAAEKIPVLGTLSKAISLPFSALGESASGVSGKLVDVLPIPQETKNHIKGGIQEISALAAQIWLGKVTGGGKKGDIVKTGDIVDISSAKQAELIKKYGFQDALTIQTKAKEMAKAESKSIEVGKTYSPDEIISKVVDSPLENTPEGKALIKQAAEAKAQGKSIEILEPPKVEPLGKDTPVYRGAKVETIDTSRPNGITGGVSFSIDKAVADRFAKNEGGTVKAYTISKDARVVDHSVLENMPRNEVANFLREYKIDVVRFDVPKGVKGEAELRVINNQVLRAFTETPKPTGVSKIGASIERKAIEQGLTKGFEGIAGYDKITIADQAKRATDLVNKDFGQARRIVRGEEDLPTGLRGTALITAMEEHIKKTGDAGVAYDLANSRLVSQTSAAAQELRLAAERQPDSLALKLRELRDAREEALKKKTGQKYEDAVKKEVGKIKEETKKTVPKREDWSAFIESIQC